MPTVQQTAARLTNQVAEGLARSFEAMPNERQTWKPLDAGRTALDQIQECAVINAWTATVLRAGVIQPLGAAAFEEAAAKLSEPAPAIERLRASCADLCAAIDAVPDSRLNDTLTLPWGREPTTLAELLFLAYWNMSYHVGQTAYIQTLYGDWETY